MSLASGKVGARVGKWEHNLALSGMAIRCDQLQFEYFPLSRHKYQYARMRGYVVDLLLEKTDLC